jgi:hypothetical protein
MIIILAGIISGFKHRFENLSWLIMIAVGIFFLGDEIFADWSLRHFFWPVVLVGLGFLFILRPKRKWRYERQQFHSFEQMDGGQSSHTAQSTGSASSEDVIESTSIFGGVKRIITSKNFKGGEIICFMGGAEYNLSQADFTGVISLEIMQAFGGTKLIVPPHWEVRTETMAIFAGVEDKRPVQPGPYDPTKILILKGTSIFGGIEIRSY